MQTTSVQVRRLNSKDVSSAMKTVKLPSLKICIEKEGDISCVSIISIFRNFVELLFLLLSLLSSVQNGHQIDKKYYFTTVCSKILSEPFLSLEISDSLVFIGKDSPTILRVELYLF